MRPEALKDLVIEALDDLKGKEIVAIDVRDFTGLMDYVVICTGTSNRHVKALADNVAVEVKKQDVMPRGIEGKNTGEWVLVDIDDVVVHVMQPETRQFYDLERLWSNPAGEQ